jgi:peptidyl-prolyl cis-trans isomerase B (cyclophilin B)
VASTKNRQRALARAKVERQIARRAAAARRRRQLQAGIGAFVAVVLVVVGIMWTAGVFSSKKNQPGAAAGDCAWTPIDPASNPDLVDVGKPPTTGIGHEGTKLMTITTNQGVIEAELDPSEAPCTVASFAFLAGKQFFQNTKCHRLTTEGIFVLQCGDPKGTGKGGPAYRFTDEYLPSPPESDNEPSESPGASPGASPTPSVPTDLYPKGTLAMANSGPDTNGSQFFIVYKDKSALEGKYTIFGKVTKGLDIVEKIAANGVADGGQSKTDGAPKTEVVIQSLTIGDAPSSAPSPSAGATPSAGPTGGTTPTATSRS